MTKSNYKLPSSSVFIGIDGTNIHSDEYEFLNHSIVAGVVLFSRNFENRAQLIELCNKLHDVKSDLVIAVDQEGGRVQRFKQGFTELPPLKIIGDLAGHDLDRAKDLSYAHGYTMAAELLACGINLSFAPVLDVYNANQVIGDRAFHNDVALIAKLSIEYLHGMRDAGIVAVAKHFPGHGGVKEDSHLEKPIDERSYHEIKQNDLLPFRQVIKNGLQAMMTSHVVYSQCDAMPASMSRFWLCQVLREELAFKGVVFSDDLGMEAAKIYDSIVDRVKLTINAGCDFALICEPGLVAKFFGNINQVTLSDNQSKSFVFKQKTMIDNNKLNLMQQKLSNIQLK